MNEESLPIEEPVSTPPPGHRRGILPAVFLLTGLYLAVVASRWFLIQEYGSPIPFWDQWLNDAPLLAAIAEGRFHLGLLLVPVNEHYIVWSKLMQIASYSLNSGQWDSQVLMTLNALVAAAVPVVALLVLGSGTPAGRSKEDAQGPWRLDPWVYGICALLWVSPLLYYNALWAFQNQFYFLMIWSMAGVYLAVTSWELSAGWWMGLGCLLAGQLSMGSGMLATAAVVGALAYMSLVQRRIERGRWWTLAICVGLVAASLLTKPDAPYSENMVARDLAEGLTAVCKHLSWPWSFDDPASTLIPNYTPRDHVYWPALLLWVPLPVLLGLMLWRPGFMEKWGLSQGELAVLAALGVWLYGHVAVLAILRGAEGRPPALRHYDLHVFGPLLNFVALRIMTRGGLGWLPWSKLKVEFRQGAALILPALYLGVVAAGVLQQQVESTAVLRERLVHNAAQASNIRAYLATGDVAHITDKPLFHLPIYESGKLEAALQSPSVRGMLPTAIRDPLPLTLEQGGDFVQGGMPPYAPRPPIRRVWGSWRAGDGGASSTGPQRGRWVLPPTRFPYLIVEYAGVFPEERPPAITSFQQGKRVGEAQIDFPPLRKWDRVELKAPTGGGVGSLDIVHPGGAGGWMAFLDPVECGWLTFWTDRWRRAASLVLGLAVLCVFLGFALGARPGNEGP